MTKLASVQSFLEPKKMAIAGVSRNPKKFGRVVYEHLKKRDYQLYGINPNCENLDGDPCYKSVADLPEKNLNLYVVTPKDQTKEVVQAAIDLACLRYKPPRLEGDIVVVSVESPESADARWETMVAGKVERVSLPRLADRHDYQHVFHEPYLTLLADAIRGLLQTSR